MVKGVGEGGTVGRQPGSHSGRRDCGDAGLQRPFVPRAPHCTVRLLPDFYPRFPHQRPLEICKHKHAREYCPPLAVSVCVEDPPTHLRTRAYGDLRSRLWLMGLGQQVWNPSLALLPTLTCATKRGLATTGYAHKDSAIVRT